MLRDRAQSIPLRQRGADRLQLAVGPAVVAVLGGLDCPPDVLEGVAHEKDVIATCVYKYVDIAYSP